MSQSAPIILSHAALAGMSIYCLIQIKDHSLFFPTISYAVIAVNNLVAVIIWLTNNSRFMDLYRFTFYCQQLFALPCMTTAIWLQNGYTREWSLAWSLVPAFFLLCYLLEKDIEIRTIDIMVLFNLVGLISASFQKDLTNGIAAGVAYALSYCYTDRITLYNYGLCFFCYFSLTAIGFAKDILPKK